MSNTLIAAIFLANELTREREKILRRFWTEFCCVQKSVKYFGIYVCTRKGEMRVRACDILARRNFFCANAANSR